MDDNFQIMFKFSKKIGKNKTISILDVKKNLSSSALKTLKKSTEIDNNFQILTRKLA